MSARARPLIAGPSVLTAALLVAGCRTVEPAPSTTGSEQPSTSAATATPSTSSDADPAARRETVAVWAPLRWGMDRPAALDALRGAGHTVTDRGATTTRLSEADAVGRSSKTPPAIVSAEVGTSRRLSVYFDERDAMNQIVLTIDALPEDDARALRTKLDARFGATKEDRRSIEKRWKLAGDGHISARVGQVDGGWVLHQERGRGSATGPVGWSDLTWGASAADTEAKLRAGGFTTKAMAPGVDPCKLPNAPPNCSAALGTEIELTKTEGASSITGRVSVGKAGLHHVAISKRGFADQTTALAEVTAIETTNGMPHAIERAQHMVWRPGTGEVVLDVKQREGKWSAIEIYRPTP